MFFLYDSLIKGHTLSFFGHTTISKCNISFSSNQNDLKFDFQRDIMFFYKFRQKKMTNTHDIQELSDLLKLMSKSA